MMRAALIAVVMLHAATACARADGFHREDLRIAMAAADPAGLEAMLSYRTGQGSVAAARDAALAGCKKFSDECAVHAVDDELVGKERAGAR